MVSFEVFLREFFFFRKRNQIKYDRLFTLRQRPDADLLAVRAVGTSANEFEFKKFKSREKLERRLTRQATTVDNRPPDARPNKWYAVVKTIVPKGALQYKTFQQEARF